MYEIMAISVFPDDFQSVTERFRCIYYVCIGFMLIFLFYLQMLLLVNASFQFCNVCGRYCSWCILFAFFTIFLSFLQYVCNEYHISNFECIYENGCFSSIIIVFDYNASYSSPQCFSLHVSQNLLEKTCRFMYNPKKNYFLLFREMNRLREQFHARLSV